MASKFKHLPDISTIQPDRLIKYRVSEDRFAAEVLLPGLSYTDFDQKIGGKVSFSSLAKLVESIRWIAMKNDFFRFPDLHALGYRLFVASQSLSLTDQMHYTRYSSWFGLNKPLLSYIYVSNVGKSSFASLLDLYDYESGVKLGSCITVMVFVNITNRKPVPLPKFFFENIDDHLMGCYVSTIEKSPVPSFPMEVFKYSVKVLHSDCDSNHHANQATYVRWCSDAASMGAHLGNFINFKKHIELYPLKLSVFHYIGECLVNDILDIKVWESSMQERGLICLISRNEKVIFFMKIDFFEGDPISEAHSLKGKMNIWSMAKLFECIRYTVLHNGFGYFDKLKDVNHSIFMAGTTYHVTERGNQLNSHQHWGMKYPLHVTLKIVYAGNSAFSFVIEVTEKQSEKELLMSSSLTFVYVDFRTRKPAQFPEWYLAAKNEQELGKPLPRLSSSSIPSDAFKFETKSSYADIDFNGHVNQSIYVKWCTDTGTEAALNGCYKHFTDNIGKYPLKSLSLKYIGEGFVDENFEIYTWQDETNPLVIHFEITKNNKLIHVAKFTYWTAEFSSRL